MFLWWRLVPCTDLWAFYYCFTRYEGIGVVGTGGRGWRGPWQAVSISVLGDMLLRIRLRSFPPASRRFFLFPNSALYLQIDHV